MCPLLFFPLVACFASSSIFSVKTKHTGDVLQVPFPSLFGPAGKYLSLVMPAYNEQDRIRSTLDETLSYLQERAKKNKSFTYEIIIVDDGSKDNTAKVGFEYVKKYTLDVVRVLKQVVNQGKGAAVRKGMLCSRGQLLLMLDADGATKITDLEKLESQILQSMPEQQGISTKSLPYKEQLPDKAVVAFGSRAHLEKQALATVSFSPVPFLLFFIWFNKLLSLWWMQLLNFPSQVFIL
jgi:dolichyl-phosphate beta-glucosyltransferase